MLKNQLKDKQNLLNDSSENKQLKKSQLNKKRLYEPEKILQNRRLRWGEQFLVKWKGYPEQESTWEPYSNISHCTTLFKNFEIEKKRLREQTIQQIDRIIDKKLVRSCLFYQVTFKAPCQEKPKFVSEKDILPELEDKVKEYQAKKIMNRKRKFFDKEFDHGSARFINKVEDEDKNEIHNDSYDYSQLDEKNIMKINTTPDFTEKNRQQNESICFSSEEESQILPSNKKTIEKINYQQQESDVLYQFNTNSPSEDVQEKVSTRKIVRARKNKCQLSNQIKEDSRSKGQGTDANKTSPNDLPSHGILGVDVPSRILEMVIDPAVGNPSDMWFACNILWEERSNGFLPLVSRVSRKDIKLFHPQVLIAFYEENLSYEGAIDQSEPETVYGYNSFQDQEYRIHPNEENDNSYEFQAIQKEQRQTYFTNQNRKDFSPKTNNNRLNY